MFSSEFETRCLGCGRINELHSNADGDIPAPGDISICWVCGNAASYGPDMQLVPLTEEQMEALEKSQFWKDIIFERQDVAHPEDLMYRWKSKGKGTWQIGVSETE
jgi:hypothetical protein